MLAPLVLSYRILDKFRYEYIHDYLKMEVSFLTFTRVTKFSNENYFRFYVRHHFFIGQTGAPALKLLTQTTNIQLREQARNLWKEILQS